MTEQSVLIIVFGPCYFKSFATCLLRKSFSLFFSGLRDILEDKLANQIPVISVVAILGTTEESAVDPLADILEVRAEMRSRVSRL